MVNFSPGGSRGEASSVVRHAIRPVMVAMVRAACAVAGVLMLAAAEGSRLVESASTVRAASTPPRMSPVQKRIMAQTAAAAKLASEAATAPLQQLLAAPEFSTALGGCCPELVSKSPTELLAMYSEQVAVTEVAHGFFAVNPPAQNNVSSETEHSCALRCCLAITLTRSLRLARPRT